MRITETVKQLIIINIIFFVGSFVVGDAAINILAMHFPISPDFKVWQIITHMFMHGSIMHILFNMFALFSFGGLLEQLWGPKKFIFFYISCGLGAVALHIGINYIQFYNCLEILETSGLSKGAVIEALNAKNFEMLVNKSDVSTVQTLAEIYFTPMLGASGAVYGLLVAFAFMFPNAELMLMFIPVPIKAKYFVPALLAYDLFFGLKGQSIFGGGDDGIAHFAHLGGALIGFIMMWYWKKNAFNNNRWN